MHVASVLLSLAGSELSACSADSLGVELSGSARTELTANRVPLLMSLREGCMREWHLTECAHAHHSCSNSQLEELSGQTGSDTSVFHYEFTNCKK